MDKDPDTILRMKCCDYVNDMAERVKIIGLLTIADPAQLIEAAQQIEHYITNGATVAFDCSDPSRKFVRGE
jgi:hypothetical protein